LSSSTQGCGAGFLTTLGFFCPTPDAQLDHFLRHTSKLGIPVEMVQFLLRLVETGISCCAPRFPQILTAKFHSFYFKESDILPPTQQPCKHRLFWGSRFLQTSARMFNKAGFSPHREYISSKNF